MSQLFTEALSGQTSSLTKVFTAPGKKLENPPNRLLVCLTRELPFQSADLSPSRGETKLSEARVLKLSDLRIVRHLGTYIYVPRPALILSLEWGPCSLCFSGFFFMLLKLVAGGGVCLALCEK